MKDEQRGSCFGCLAELSLVAITVITSPCGVAQETVASSTLRPAGSFVIPVEPSLRPIHLVAGLDSLFFLMASPTERQIIRTSLDGALISRTSTSSNAFRFVVGPSADSIWVLLRDRRTVEKVSMKGSPGSSQALPRMVTGLVYSLGKLLAWDDSGVYSNGPASAALHTGSIELSSPSYAMELEGAVAVVDDLPTLTVVESTGAVLQTRLFATEIVPKQPDPPGVKTLTVYSACSDGIARIFLGISPFKEHEGAPLLEFTRQGRLRARFKLELPVVPETKGRVGDYFIPTDFALARGRVFALSRGVRRCIYYALPAQ